MMTDVQPPSNGVWLFGGAHCGVCQVIKPQLEQHLRRFCPQWTLQYSDCEAAPAVCAQQGVFSLPVIRLYLNGRLFLEEVQVFSLTRVFAELDRFYRAYHAHE